MNIHVTFRRHIAAQGLSLVETLVVLATSTVLLAVLVSALSALFSIERRAKQAATEGWSASRLPEQIRQDVWSASKVEWHAEAGELLLSTLGTNTITYRFGQSRCIRIVNGSDRTTAEHAYRLPTRGQVEVTPLEAGPTDILKLTWTVMSPAPHTSRNEGIYNQILTQKMVVGRDQQLLYE